MLLALTSAAGASKTGFLDIWYLIKHSSGYTFHFGKNTKTSKLSILKGFEERSSKQ